MLKNIFVCIIGTLLIFQTKAQIGIGTTTPAPSAVLDLTASDKGLLVPRMSASNRIILPAPANGLLVFDTDSATLFIYQQTGGWRKMLPVSNLGTIIAGNAAGDVLVWSGTAWVVTSKCNLFNYYFRDKDNDGKGDKYSPLVACAPLSGFVADSSDCDDNNVAIGIVFQYRDADSDGFGDPNLSLSACTPPTGYVSNNTDCNDANAAINPGAVDLPDDSFADLNCDGIDGNEAVAIFVSTSGSNANPGTKAAPVQTINSGITKAGASGKTQVLVAAGTYVETVTMQSGISVYGGYSSVNWSRSAGNTTTINGQASSIYAGIIASGVTNAVIDRFVITAPNATGATGLVSNSSYGVYGVGNANFTIRNCVITAGSGAAGVQGANGATGAAGGNGTNGSFGNCDNSISAPGGIGGSSTCSRNGGSGGFGGYNTANGNFGNSGAGGIPGGIGGNSGSPGGPGNAGTNGSAGADGTSGTGGTIPLGTISANIWSGSSGNPGGTPGDGKGGGGGGGGGGQSVSFPLTPGTGNGGGGGGAGGCFGGSGGAGTAGGGSIAVFFAAPGSGIAVINNSLITSSGGNGGAGGNGAAGGLGGGGGFGPSFCTSEVGAGGSGGSGGKGGNGAGGGGGGGGISYGIYAGAAGVTSTGNSFTIGVAGTGGAGGTSPTNAGTAGVAGASGTKYP